MERGVELGWTTGPLVEDHDLVLLDLDGVVYIGAYAVPHAVEAIGRLERPVVYLTNNATRAAEDVAEHLRSFGLQVSDADVITAGQVVADLVVEHVGAGSAVLVAGSDALRGALSDRGLAVVHSAADSPSAVVQGGVLDVRWSELAEASYAVAAGVPWFTANPDLTFPTPRGVAPGNGAMVHAVSLATGTEPLVAGKPARPIFDEARRRAGATRPVMVGDRPDTDIDGAIAADMDSVVVLTGISRVEELAALPRGRRPTYVASDLRDLHVPHPPVEIVGVEARCGDAVAVQGRPGEFIVTGASPRSLNGLRAHLAIAWATMDT